MYYILTNTLCKKPSSGRCKQTYFEVPGLMNRSHCSHEWVTCLTLERSQRTHEAQTVNLQVLGTRELWRFKIMTGKTFTLFELCLLVCETFLSMIYFTNCRGKKDLKHDSWQELIKKIIFFVNSNFFFFGDALQVKITSC